MMSKQINAQTGFRRTYSEENQNKDALDFEIPENSKVMHPSSNSHLEKIMQGGSQNLKTTNTDFSINIKNRKLEQLYDKVASSDLISVSGSNFMGIQGSQLRSVQGSARAQVNANINNNQKNIPKANQFIVQSGKRLNESNLYDIRQSNRQITFNNAKLNTDSNRTIPRVSIKEPIGRPSTYNASHSIILPQNLKSCLSFQSYMPVQQVHFGTAENGIRYELPDQLERILCFDQILNKQKEGDKLKLEVSKQKSWIVE